MNSSDTNHEFLLFFKALADSNRLKIVGSLALGEKNVEQLAELVELRQPTVSHHLARLGEAGLVTARAEGHYSVYRLEADQLEAMARRLLASETLPTFVDDHDLEANDRKVLSDFITAKGRLKTIPSQRKKLSVILNFLVRIFEPGIQYREREVNDRLSQFHEDTATLRRELVGAGLLERKRRGIYWRPTR